MGLFNVSKITGKGKNARQKQLDTKGKVKTDKGKIPTRGKLKYPDKLFCKARP